MTLKNKTVENWSALVQIHEYNGRAQIGKCPRVWINKTK